MTTINLRDGLEALYYFGEQDFNPQRNQLQDHSGYGRHATAQGGPTVGVNGPNDFEAASFDGADDIFTLSNTLETATTPRTTFILAKYSTNNTNTFQNWFGVSGGGGSNPWFFKRGRGENLTYYFQNGSGSDATVTIPFPVDTWMPIVGIWNTEQLRLLSPYDTSTTSVSTHDTGISSGANTTYIKGNSEPIQFASIARWFRTLSDAEVEQLFRLTAPLKKIL